MIKLMDYYRPPDAGAQPLFSIADKRCFKIMPRQIECSQCQKPMGEIRDASLRKGIYYLCTGCKKTIDIMMALHHHQSTKNPKSFDASFSEIFSRAE